MNQRLIAGISLFCLIFSNSSWAGRGGDQGYGIILGNPSGFSAKFWLDDQWAFDGAAGVARSEFDVHATLLHHNFTWSSKFASQIGWVDALMQNGDLPFYYGVGPRMLFEKNEEFGIRFPVGLSYIRHQSNWETFIEFAPVLRLTPDSGFNADYSVGVRYYFKSIQPMEMN